MNQAPLVSVIIITRNRPKMLKKCLEHLLRQEYQPFETIVVDSSTNQRTEQLVQNYPEVQYVFMPDGQYKMPQSRNLGLQHAKGEIIAFIDDDSMVREGWLENIVAGYTSPDIGGVGGRAIDPGEAYWLDKIEPTIVGRFFEDGSSIGNFAAEPETSIEVDRFKGCNMSFRKEMFDLVGGFDGNYTITNAFEDSDFCIRVKHEGYKLIFNPKAVVDHIYAPKQGIKRDFFNPKVHFSYCRNRTYFLLKNYGWHGKHIPSLVTDNCKECFLRFRHNRSFEDCFSLWANVIGKIIGMFAAFRRRNHTFVVAQFIAPSKTAILTTNRNTSATQRK